MTAFELEGISPAIPTPRYESDDPVHPGDVNYDAVEEHVEYLAEGGVHGVTVAGCTGLASELPYEEHVAYIRRVADIARENDLDVIAGTGTNSTRESYELGQAAEEVADFDAHLMITPYKVKPEPVGMETHYEALADRLDEPIILYDVPSRTGRQMDVDSVIRLAEHDNIIGLKDATGDAEYRQRIDGLLETNDIDDFNIVSGDDPNSHDIYELENGAGTISVTANVYPEAVVDVWEQGYVEENYDAAAEMNQELMELHEAMFLETNPGPVHAALGMTLHPDYEHVPSPLSQIQPENRERLGEILGEYGLLEETVDRRV